MRKLSLIALLLAVLCAPALAGDVNTPGGPTPPPCTENCGAANPTEDSLMDAITELVLMVI